MTILLLLALFQLKHLICDFFLQVPYHYKNKGTYGHPGGGEHAVIHALGTTVFLPWFTGIGFAVLLVLAEAIFHYHVDWAKMNINAARGWGPTTHESFWYLLGVDQALHQISYIVMVAIILA